MGYHWWYLVVFRVPHETAIVVSWEICELNGIPLVVSGILLPRGAFTLGLFGARLVTCDWKITVGNRFLTVAVMGRAMEGLSVNVP